MKNQDLFIAKGMKTQQFSVDLSKAFSNKYDELSENIEGLDEYQMLVSAALFTLIGLHGAMLESASKNEKNSHNIKAIRFSNKSLIEAIDQHTKQFLGDPKK